MSTVGINGKVYFMDKKYDPGNTTGAYELDPSLVRNPNWADAWRSKSIYVDLGQRFDKIGIVISDARSGRDLLLRQHSSS